MHFSLAPVLIFCCIFSAVWPVAELLVALASPETMLAASPETMLAASPETMLAASPETMLATSDVVSSSDVSSSCPANFIYNSLHGTCARAFTSSISWFEARRTCTQLNGKLVKVDSYDMVTFLTSTFGQALGAAYWIDIHDIWHDMEFWTTSHVTPTYFLWENEKYPQPNDQYHVQSCVSSVAADNYMWQDKSCFTYPSSTVCEFWPGADTTDPLNTKEFIKVREPYVLGFDLTLRSRGNLTAARADCARACANDLYCDVFGMLKIGFVENNCALMTFEENKEGFERKVDAWLSAFQLFYK